jgi:putative CRISPR-associated protein (TIGR02619 family)
MPPHTLISTAGTSLLLQARRRASVPGADALFAQLVDAIEQGRLSEATAILARFDPEDDACGAELASLRHLVAREKVDLQALHLLVSDTPQGAAVGKVIAMHVREQRQITVTVNRISDLDPENPTRFALKGLRSLVACIGRIIRETGSDYVAIDATGGFKAQTSMAVLAGQVLRVPVYYRFERFDTIIDLPPMPVSIDAALIDTHLDVFALLEREDVIATKEIIPLPPEVLVLVEREKEGGKHLLALNAFGQLALDGLRLRTASVELPDLPDDERKPPSIQSHHWANGYKEWMHRIFESERWIRHMYSRDYDGQRGIKGGRFVVRDLGESGLRLEGEYVDGDGFGARVGINLGGRPSREQLQAAAMRLNDAYGQESED